MPEGLVIDLTDDDALRVACQCGELTVVAVTREGLREVHALITEHVLSGCL